jgi:hypothetical protein
MSYGAWEAGKGYKSRVANFRGFWNNFDNIKGLTKNKQLTGKALFLDDWRTPKQATLWSTSKKPLIEVSNIPNSTWNIVRSYDEFVEFIEKNGIPEVVSFDNDLVDLANDMLPTGEVYRMFAMDYWQNIHPKMGVHCAEYLVEKCKELGQPIPKYYIHTANGKAAEIIKEIMENGKQNV